MGVFYPPFGRFENGSVSIWWGGASQGSETLNCGADYSFLLVNGDELYRDK